MFKKYQLHPKYDLAFCYATAVTSFWRKADLTDCGYLVVARHCPTLAASIADDAPQGAV
jgi:hypothetical protein